jgi:CRISPR-associated RAMP protein (TIGR02581 family)
MAAFPLHVFSSRLSLVGEFVLDSPLRIGTGPESDETLLDSENRPLIPATTFRGALRAYVESALRSVVTQRHETRHTITLRGPDGRPAPTTRTVKVCCDSVDKRDDDLNYQGCLTRAIVARWEADPVLRPQLDSALIECTCRVCRLFGTPWLAGRVSVADLTVPNGDWSGETVIFGGLSINRDTDTAIEGSIYHREAVPAGTRFTFQLTLENASAEEQGMILLGLRAFEAGLISLGSDRSRGLGRGHLAIDWWNCRYISAEYLIGALLVGEAPQVFTAEDAEDRITALATMLRAP